MHDFTLKFQKKFISKEKIAELRDVSDSMEHVTDDHSVSNEEDMIILIWHSQYIVRI